MKPRITYSKGYWISRYIPLGVFGVGKTIPEAYKHMMNEIAKIRQELMIVNISEFGNHRPSRAG